MLKEGRSGCIEEEEVTHTEGGRVLGMVSQEKWNKTKLLIAELVKMILNGPLSLQCLLKIRGFLM